MAGVHACQNLPLFVPPFLKIITRSNFEILRSWIKASLLIFSTCPGSCSTTGVSAHVNHVDPTTDQFGHRHGAPIGVFKWDWFLPDPHLVGRQSIHVFSKKKKKRKNQFQYIKTVTFRMKPVDGSRITICASSVHEYPSFFVRSISGRSTVFIARVKSIITPPKVGYQFTITRQAVIKMSISLTE